MENRSETVGLEKIFGWLEKLCEVQLLKSGFFPSIGFPEYSSVHRGAPTIPSMLFLK